MFLPHMKIINYVASDVRERCYSMDGEQILKKLHAERN